MARIQSSIPLFLFVPWLLSAQVRLATPDWTDLKGPYIEETARVKIGVDRSGAPFAIESDEPLPDNVVRALRASRFDDKQYRGHAVAINVPVRRPLADGRERLLMPDWIGSPELWQLRDAKQYSAKDLERLERNANDEHAAAALLAYYSLCPDPAADVARHRRLELIEWFLKNKPEADVLGTPLAMINTKDDRLADPAGFSTVAAQWQFAVASHPDDSDVLDHAVRFLAVPDGNSALRLINSAPHWSARLRWAGRIYALRALGATSVDLESGDIHVSPSAVDESSRKILLQSGSTPLVLSAMWTVTSSEYAAPDFCPQLLERARKLYAETAASCPAANASAKRQHVEAKLQNKVQPRYPEAAKQSLIQGTVEFQALVDKTGTIIELELRRAPLVFYDPSRSAVLQWRYSPVEINGEPRAFTTEITVHYTLSR